MSNPPTPADVVVVSTDAGLAVTFNGGEPIPVHPGIEIVAIPPAEPGAPRYVTLAVACSSLVIGPRPLVATVEGCTARVWGGGAGRDPRVPIREAVTRG